MGRNSAVKENWKEEEEKKECLPVLHFLSVLPLELQNVDQSSLPSTLLDPASPNRLPKVASSTTLVIGEPAKLYAYQLGHGQGQFNNYLSFSDQQSKCLLSHTTFRDLKWTRLHPLFRFPAQIVVSPKFQSTIPLKSFHYTPRYHNPTLSWYCSNILQLLNLDISVSPFYSLSLPTPV